MLNKFDKDKITLQEELKLLQNMDEAILILRSLIEILETKFIKNTYFSNTNSETIKSYLNFLNDFEQNIDIAKKSLSRYMLLPSRI